MQRMDYMYGLPQAQMAAPVVLVRALVRAQTGKTAGRAADLLVAQGPMDSMVAPAGSAQA